MTCIVGVTNGSTVCIAADSGYSDNFLSCSSRSPKIFERNKYVIGYSGNIGIGQNVCYNFYPDVSGIKEEDYMYKVFIPELRNFVNQMLSESNMKSDLIEDSISDFIVGIDGRLFEISSLDFQCSEHSYIAIGSGAQIAMGYLYKCMNDGDKKNDNYIGSCAVGAVEAAVFLNPHCEKPIKSIRLDK